VAAVVVASAAWVVLSDPSVSPASETQPVAKSHPAEVAISQCGIAGKCKPQWTSAAAGAPLCSSDEYQLSEGSVVVPCTGASGKIALDLRRGEKLSVVSLPIGAGGLKVVVEGHSGVDFDTHIVDDASGKCLIGPGCTLHGELHRKAYNGMTISYTGDSSFIRFERTEVHDKMTRPLTIQVVGASAGKGSVEYWVGNYDPDSCPSPTVGCGFCHDYSCPISGEKPITCNGTTAVQCAAITTTVTTTTVTTHARRRRHRTTTTRCPFNPFGPSGPEEGTEVPPPNHLRHVADAKEGGEEKTAREQKFELIATVGGDFFGMVSGRVSGPAAVMAILAGLVALPAAVRVRRVAAEVRGHALLGSGDGGGGGMDGEFGAVE